MFGLSVLKRLVADKNAAPVLVVTGYYHEPEIEADALRAGAAAFRHKPLIIDDLTAVLCLIVNRPVHSEAVVQRSEPVAVGISLSEIPGPPALAVSPSSRRARIFALSRKLADPSGTTLEFVTTAGMLRRMLKGWRGTDRPLGPIDVLPRDVRMVIQYLELKVRSRCVLLEADLESKLAMHSGDSGRLLTLHTGAGYREWRRALRLRPAVHPLAFSDEHIRQIAYRIGYEHPSQFDRDFYQAFGLTPTDYRWLCKAARS